MLNINTSALRNNLFKHLESVITFQETININTKHGNAVIISEEEYNGLMETLSICATHGMKDKIIDGLNTPFEKCLSEDEVQW